MFQLDFFVIDIDCVIIHRMSVIHYKFKSSLEYDTLTFDGFHISVADLKKAIIEQKKLGKNGQFHLSITDAQTKQGKV